MNNNTRNCRKCVIGAYPGRVAHDDALDGDMGEVLAALSGKARDRGIAALYGHIGVPEMDSGLRVGDAVRRARDDTRGKRESSEGLRKVSFYVRAFGGEVPGHL